MPQDYRLIADRVARQITAGRIRPGERLPPQRTFAKRNGIAVSTATRVYAELIRRGLTVGEVGRGTFVRAVPAPAVLALSERSSAPIDLEYNFPVLDHQPALQARGLARLARTDALKDVLAPVGAAGTGAAREAAAQLLARGSWRPAPDRLLFAGSGRQAIAATLAAIARPGDQVGVEAISYPVLKGIALHLGIRLVPLALDEHGVDPEAVAAAHKHARLTAVYLQPALHNPLGTSMSQARREAVAELARTLDLVLVEDAIYSFLHDDLPLASLAPERTVLIDSMSKRLAPGLTVGFAVTPPDLAGRVRAAAASGGWTPSRFALEATTEWITDGTAADVARAKRVDAGQRQDLLRECLAGLQVRSDPRAYHAWWELPEPWRAETFVAAAARLGIAVSPAGAFAMGTAIAPPAVRLALASPAVPTLRGALDALAAVARGGPDESFPQ